MSKTLAEKMVIKPGYRGAVINPPDNYTDLLGPLPEDVELTDAATATDLDFVHLFVKSIAELDQHATQALKAIKHDALLWISYPKGSGKIDTDINRDNGWDVIKNAGMRPVTQVSVDSTWSALRWRPKPE